MMSYSDKVAYSWRGKSVNVGAPCSFHNIIKAEFAGLDCTTTIPTAPTLDFVLDRPSGLPEIVPAHAGLREFLQGQHATLFSSSPERSVSVSCDEINRLVIKLILTIVFKQLHWPDMLFFEATTVVLPDGDTVMIIGPSGSGKSALALEILERGGKLISDDITPVGLYTHRACAFPFLKRIDIPTGPNRWRPYDVSVGTLAKPTACFHVSHTVVLETAVADWAADLPLEDTCVTMRKYCTSSYPDPFDWRFCGQTTECLQKIVRALPTCTRLPWCPDLDSRLAVFMSEE